MNTAAAHSSLVRRALFVGELVRRNGEVRRDHGGRIPRSVGDGAEVEGVRLSSRPVDPSRISGKSKSDSRTGPESASLSFVDPFRGVGRVPGDRRIPVVGVGGGPPSRSRKSRCGDTSEGSAGTVAGAAPGLLRGQLRGPGFWVALAEPAEVAPLETGDVTWQEPAILVRRRAAGFR